MGKSEDNTPSKSKKESSSAQAYYGPGVPFPSPYLYSAVMDGHVPQTYVWAPPQPLMPPYGVPYTTIYLHGRVCAHPAVPLVVTPLSKMPPKSSDHLDQGLTKKLKMLDGLAVPVGNDSAEADAGGSVYEASQSLERGIVGSTEGSDGNTGAYQTPRKGGSEGILSTGKSVGSPNEKIDTSGAGVASSGAGLSFEVWVQDERQLKRERRKQDNRESARRSRLRKQDENNELIMRYESLNVENMALKSELNQLTEDSENLRLENAALLERLNNAPQGSQAETVPDKMEAELTLPDITESLLGLNNSDSVTGNFQRECESHENSNCETKRHQRLESSSRADAVVAG